MHSSRSSKPSAGLCIEGFAEKLEDVIATSVRKLWGIIVENTSKLKKKKNTSRKKKSLFKDPDKVSVMG